MASKIESLTGSYGIDWKPGILSEHLSMALAAGLVVHSRPTGATWVHDPNGGKAVRVVCSEIIAVSTEDGMIGGRCGKPVEDEGCCGFHAEVVREYRRGQDWAEERAEALFHERGHLC